MAANDGIYIASSFLSYFADLKALKVIQMVADNTKLRFLMSSIPPPKKNHTESKADVQDHLLPHFNFHTIKV